MFSLQNHARYFFGNISSTHFYCPSLYKSHGFHREQNLLLASIFQDISQHILSSENVNMTRSCNVDSEYISLSSSMFFQRDLCPRKFQKRSENPCFMDMEIWSSCFSSMLLTVGRSVMSDSYRHWLTVAHRTRLDWSPPISQTQRQVFDLTLCSSATAFRYTCAQNPGLDLRLSFRCANASFSVCLQLVGFWYVLLRGVWVLVVMVDFQ